MGIRILIIINHWILLFAIITEVYGYIHWTNDPRLRSGNGPRLDGYRPILRQNLKSQENRIYSDSVRNEDEDNDNEDAIEPEFFRRRWGSGVNDDFEEPEEVSREEEQRIRRLPLPEYSISRRLKKSYSGSIAYDNEYDDGFYNPFI
jgi:hypothetical protein